MDSRLEAAHRAEIQRQEIEEQSTLGFRGQRDHLALLLVRSFLVDDLQIRCLAAQPGAIVHDLAVNLPGCEVDETQRLSSNADTPSRGCRSAHLSFWRLGVFISYGGYSPQVTQVTPALKPCILLMVGSGGNRCRPVS